MEFKKILLIRPDYPRSPFPLPVWPIGLGCIAESLKSSRINYEVVDLWLNYKNKKKHLYNTIEDYRPDIIGLSLMTSRYKYHYSLICDLKKAFPDIPIIVGGPHVSTMKDKVLLDCQAIDYGVTGEGEETIVELCKGTSPEKIKGLLYKKGANVMYAGPRDRIRDLDALPFPSYDGFEIDKYDTKSINIISSRGCPHNCIYCCVKLVLGKAWQARSAKNVVDEIEYWYDRGYRVFNFNDDAFNINKQRVFDICGEIENRKLVIELNAPNGIRADRVDRELLIRMKEVGFQHLAFGVEAGNDKVLKKIKKGETIQEIEESIKNASELGFDIELFFLIGSPSETAEDIEDSFRLATKYHLKDVRFYNLIPYPNTELYDWVKENNFMLLEPEHFLNGDLLWVNEPIFQTPELSLSQRKDVYKRGLKLGTKIRKKYRYKYYVECFYKLGVLAYVIGFLASRDISQYFLKKSHHIQNLRLLLKRVGIFDREIKVNER